MTTTSATASSARVVRRAGTGDVLRLQPDRPHGRGGEAVVVGVPGAPDLVAKLYHDRLSRRARGEREAKLRAMLATPPKAAGPRPAVAWPVDLLHDARSGAFAGFLMPRVPDGLLWHQVSDPIDRLRRAPGVSYEFLLGAAANLCDAVTAVHAAGHVVGDTNPGNAIVHRDALVTLVDVDSFQISTPHGRFACPAGMLPYVAPEVLAAAGTGGDFAPVVRTPAGDAWGVAVLVHELLTGGVDPTAMAAPSPASRRGAGLHPADVLAPALRDLVVRCFGAGHGSPAARPTVAEWARACRAAARELVTCPVTPTHRYGRHLGGCPHCAHRSVTGIDLYPDPAVVRAGRQLEPHAWRAAGAGTRHRRPARQATRQAATPGGALPAPGWTVQPQAGASPGGAPAATRATPSAAPPSSAQPTHLPAAPPLQGAPTPNRGFMMAVAILLAVAVLRTAYLPAETPTVWLAAAAAIAASWAALRPPPGRGRAPGGLVLAISAALAHQGTRESQWRTRQPWRPVAELAWGAHVPAPFAARLGDPRGVWLARAALAGGDTARAQELLARTLETRPDAAAAHAVVGRIALRQGRLDSAQASLIRAVDLAQWDPRVSPEDLLLLARTVCRRGNVELGRRLLGHAVRRGATALPVPPLLGRDECRPAERS